MNRHKAVRIVLMLGLALASIGRLTVPPAVSDPVPSEVHINEKRNGATVRMTAGQLLVLTLPSNPSTGYSWDITGMNADLLKQYGPAETAQRSSQPMPGEPGTITYRFRAIGAGSDTLQLSYRRSFEPPSIPAIQEYRIRVRIQPRQ
jgi:inhibitor of cysteine peptidase